MLHDLPQRSAAQNYWMQYCTDLAARFQAHPATSIFRRTGASMAVVPADLMLLDTGSYRGMVMFPTIGGSPTDTMVLRLEASGRDLPELCRRIETMARVWFPAMDNSHFIAMNAAPPGEPA